MASSLSNLFGESKVFLLNTKAGEATELGKITADSITLDPAEDGEDKMAASVFDGGKLVFSATLHSIDRKKVSKLFEMTSGFQRLHKSRKATYKTIRRDCAKRNRCK